MVLYSELPEHDCPPRGRRANIDKASRTSEISINLDDLRDLRPELPRDLSGFSLSCWEEASGEDVSKFFDIGDLDDADNEESLEGDMGRENPKQPLPRSKSFNLEWVITDDRKRKVRFSSDLEQVRYIERADPEDYPSLFYCVHELQRMADEFRTEEQNARRHSIR
jgi:hypothetical protein